ncbi:MAG: hypothetical protein JKY65_28150 [Planctomycetes bacterium]|nr:hypothetical protein [Planctomycetota bacterium]
MDRLLRSLQRAYAEDSTPEAAMAWASAALRGEGAEPLTWNSLERNPDPKLAKLASQLRPALRIAVKGYFAGTEWAQGGQFRSIPLSELSRLTRAHWLALSRVGPGTVDRVERLLAASGCAIEEGSSELAELELHAGAVLDEADVLSLLRQLNEAESLQAAWRARCVLLERMVRANLEFQEQSEVLELGETLEEIAPGQRLKEQEWEERFVLFSTVVQQDLTRLLEEAGSKETASA